MAESWECLLRQVGYSFTNIKLLERALTHPSYAAQAHQPGADYERMEYLGDAVLELSVSRYLFDNCPKLREGDLTRARASLVCEDSLYRAALSLELGNYIRMSNGEAQHGGRLKASILSDVYESLLCAIYLDGGFEAADAFVKRSLLLNVQDRLAPKKDNKTALQELVAKNDPKAQIRYTLLREWGPDHQKSFSMEVSINGEPMGQGIGASKQLAGQEAAKEALERFNSR